MNGVWGAAAAEIGFWCILALNLTYGGDDFNGFPDFLK